MFLKLNQRAGSTPSPRSNIEVVIPPRGVLFITPASQAPLKVTKWCAAPTISLIEFNLFFSQ